MGKSSSILGSGEEFDETQLRACCRDLGWGSVDYLKRSFSECKVDHNQIKFVICYNWHKPRSYSPLPSFVFLFFSVTTFSHRPAPRIKKKYLAKADENAQKLRVRPLSRPCQQILGPPGVHLGFCRWCGAAGICKNKLSWECHTRRYKLS